jgi:3-dehydrosphinganine reductase
VSSGGVFKRIDLRRCLRFMTPLDGLRLGPSPGFVPWAAGRWAGVHFASKVVFVPGGSSGIGLEVAKLVAAGGADVAVLARREDVLRRAAAEITASARSPSQRVAWRSVDVGDAAQVRAAIDGLVRELGAPDVLVNCAGRAHPDYFERIDGARLADTLRVNLVGTWNTVAAVVPHMKSRRGGYIVNTSSLAGLIGVFGYTDYCASKFAVVGFSEALRAELEPHGITVSVLCPPDTDTPGFAEENRTKPPETAAVSEGGSTMRPDEVAAELLRGMARRRFLIIAGRTGRMAHVMKRLWPSLVDREMRRRVRSVRGSRP